MDVQRQRSGSLYWLITRGDSQGISRDLEIYSTEIKSGRLLPVFVSEEKAERFVEDLTADGSRESSEDSWKIRHSGAGELISLLSGSAFSAGACAGVDRVIVDPPPDLFDTLSHNGSSEPVGESRGCFLDRLMGWGRSWFELHEADDRLIGRS